MLTTPKMLETETKATSTSHQNFSLPEIQLAKIQIGPVPNLAKKKQTLYSHSTLKNNCLIVLIQHCAVLYSIANTI